MTGIFEKTLITGYLLLVILLSFIFSLPILVISYPFVSQKSFCYMNECIGKTLILGAMDFLGIWEVKITDKRKDKRNIQCVYIANHDSYIDVLLMWKLPNCKKFIMAKKFTQIPIFGWLCEKGGHVPVDRFDKSTTVCALDKCISSAKDGSSFAIFPEGRRSPISTKLLEFKTGAFRLAQKLNIPIVPVAVKGSDQALPVGASLCDYSKIELVIGDPIYVSKECENIKEDKSISKAREFIKSVLPYKNNKNKQNNKKLMRI